MFVKTGTYVGNGVSGATTNPITGIGFQPRFVWVQKDNDTQMAIGRSESMGANKSKFLADNVAISTGVHITSLDADGFTVTGNNAGSNTNGATYFYTAIGGEGTDFMYGSYTGNGADNRDITIGGSFSATPDMVIVLSEGADRVVFGTTEVVGFSAPFGLVTAANNIQTFGSGTFQVGTDAQVNSNSVVYHYVAFKEQAGVFFTFNYTGNNTDNRNLTGFGFQPTVALTQWAGGTSQCITRNAATHSGDESISFKGAAADAANKIQDFISDGIQLGTSAEVNFSGLPYFGFAFKDAAAATPVSVTMVVMTADAASPSMTVLGDTVATMALMTAAAAMPSMGGAALGALMAVMTASALMPDLESELYKIWEPWRRQMDPADWPGVRPVYLEIHGEGLGGGDDFHAYLWNETDGLKITDSDVSISATVPTRGRSIAFSLTSGSKIYHIQFLAGHPMYDAVVIVDREP